MQRHRTFSTFPKRNDSRNFMNHSQLMKNFEALHQEQSENNRTGSLRILVLNEENE